MYDQIDFNKPMHVYFCGIGGISMSGLAEILKSRGFTVSGSDRAESEITKHLENEGIHVFIGQKAENITPDIDLVVFTAAIHPDNPEYKRTIELGLNHLTRAQVLGDIMKNYGCPIAISGTHGKTTTTSMISEILLAEDADPTISVGGILKSIGGNVRVGHSDYFVAEACEYTNSFLSLFPLVGIILDIDADHLDFFKDLADIRASFRKFAELIPEAGTLIINSDIENLDEITHDLKCHIVYYGSRKEYSDYYAEDITYDNLAHPTYTLVRKSDGTRQKITLHVPGIHNVWNSLAAIACSDLLEVNRDTAAKALLDFGGTDRRFEFKGRLASGTAVIDDYAHHPTEIAATLNAARQLKANRIFVVFQPHTYTRTKALMDDFAKALSIADVVILADIYAARETDTLGISSRTLEEKIKALGHEQTYYFPTFSEIEKFVLKNCIKDDVLITMGAGNVNTVAKDLLQGEAVHNVTNN